MSLSGATGPNFFVVGAPRCGTTSLHHYLAQHPGIFMCPRKEPNYFAFYGEPPVVRGSVARWVVDGAVFSRAEYEALFRDAGDAKAIGEVSPRYLSNPLCAGRIHRDVPNAKIIAILRQPADRAYTAFVGLRRDGWEPCEDFVSAIHDEPRRLAEGWDSGCLLDRGFYFEKLERYFGLFGRERIRVDLYEDLQTDAVGMLRGIFEFLEVDPDFKPDVTKVHNPTGFIRNPLLAAFWSRSYRLRKGMRRVVPKGIRDAAYAAIQRNSEKPRLEPELRAEVTAHFREDILKLQDLIQRDLSHWLAS